jgi:hypothetical protein
MCTSTADSAYIKYLQNKKKIYGSDDLRLLGSDFDASEYTFVTDIDTAIGNIMHGMNFKRVIIKNKNAWRVSDEIIYCVYQIFHDALHGKFTCKSFDIDINIHARCDIKYNKNILRFCDLIREILKSYTVNKFNIMLPGHLNSIACKKFFINHLANIPRINIEWINSDGINEILGKNVTELNIRQLGKMATLETYANMTSLTYLHISYALIVNVEYFYIATTIRKIFTNNEITSVQIDTDVIESNPDIMNLFAGTKKFKLVIYYRCNISTIDYICNCLKKLALDKFVLSKSIIPKNFLDYLSECTVPKIKFKRELDCDQWLTIISNPNVKYIITNRIRIGINICNYSYNLDHLIELRVIIDDQDQIDSFIKFLERSLTDNSEIQYVEINDKIVNSSWLLDLINKNLDYKLSRLYKVTKPIMPADTNNIL